jgi:hypothetical protein
MREIRIGTRDPIIIALEAWKGREQGQWSRCEGARCKFEVSASAKPLPSSLGEVIPVMTSRHLHHPNPPHVALCNWNLQSIASMSRARPLLNRIPFKSPCQSASQSFRSSTYHAHRDLPLPLQSRIRWSYFWYASILALGITTGLGARHFAAPLGLPEPGSREDEIILDSLRHDIDALEIVQSLRSQSYNLHTDTALRSGPGLNSSPPGSSRKISAYKGWLELDLDFGRENEGKKGILGVMSGTRGLGVQRAFWNAETREMVAVVWIGGGMSGWPGVAHGGAIATIFEEIMARMVRGPDGIVGACTFSSGCESQARANTQDRTSPPSRLPQPNLRQTDLQPRLLRPPRLLLKT